MRIAIAADHNATSMKDHVCAWLTQRDHEVTDRGVHPDSGIVDYPPLCADVGALAVTPTSASFSAAVDAASR